MIRTNNTISDIQIAYIGGGSKGWAWGLMSDLAIENTMHGTVRLYDIDKQAALDNAIIGNQLKGREDVCSQWHYEAVESLEAALTGADFVILSILPGTFEHMKIDVHAPEAYGIYQAVGDTVGPGGLSRSLRTIPMYVEIANAIKSFSPNAWVLNYTNPMTICTQVLYKVFPEIKAFGNCHEVFGTQKLLISALADIEGITDATREDIKVNVLGINHFTWITKATYKDMDLFPIYEKFVNKYFETGFEDGKTGNWMNDFFSSAHRVKFDLFRRYGIIAAAGDRHLAEFCPMSWYLKDPETVKSWKFGLTPVSWRLDNQKERFERANRLISGEEIFELKVTGEEGVRQMKALLGLADLVTNVNIPNRGQMPQLPLGTVVETNALFQKDAVSPIQAGDLPLPVLNMVTRHVYNQACIIESSLTENERLALQALLNDPLVHLSPEDAAACFKALKPVFKA